MKSSKSEIRFHRRRMSDKRLSFCLIKTDDSKKTQAKEFTTRNYLIDSEYEIFAINHFYYKIDKYLSVHEKLNFSSNENLFLLFLVFQKLLKRISE